MVRIGINLLSRNVADVTQECDGSHKQQKRAVLRISFHMQHNKMRHEIYSLCLIELTLCNSIPIHFYFIKKWKVSSMALFYLIYYYALQFQYILDISKEK